MSSAIRADKELVMRLRFPHYACALLLTASITACSVTSGHKRHPYAEQAVTRLVEVDASGLWEARAEVKKLDSGAMPELYEQLRYVETDGKLRIIEAASHIAQPSELLLAIFDRGADDDDATVRHSVATRAGRYPSMAEEVTPLLRGLLEDKDSTVRAAAVSGLGALPGKKAITPVEIAALTLDSDVAVAANAISVAVKRREPNLQIIASRALPKLVDALESESPTTRATAAFAIGQFRRLSEGEIRSLTKLTSSTELPEVRLQAAIALVRIGTPPAKNAAIPVLKAFAHSKNATLKRAATAALSVAQKK